MSQATREIFIKNYGFLVFSGIDFGVIRGGVATTALVAG